MKNTGLLHIGFVAILALFTACSNDSDGEKDVLEPVEFTVNFADYNAEQELGVTRSGKQSEEFEERVVDLGNNVLAQVTLQRDTTKASVQAITRGIADDTYTMLAYDHDTHAFKGATTGKVISNKFVATSSKLRLAAGKYDFVLFNSKVSRNGDRLIIPRSNATTALIGRTTQEIKAAGAKSYVAFNLKRVGARILLHLTGYTPFENVKAAVMPVNGTAVPGSSVYDAATGTLSAGEGETFAESVTYKESKNTYYGPYEAYSQNYAQMLAFTDVSKLKLVFTGGSMYGEKLANVQLPFKPALPLTIEQNGSYILKVKLFYSFLYLMSDGTTGFINETTYGGGTKTPIAVVLSQSKRMGIALKFAKVSSSEWCHYKYKNYYANTYTVEVEKGQTVADAIWGSLAKSGIDETWDANYSTSKVQGSKVKGLNEEFYAFYAAAHYDPGVPYSGANPIKWYLPSASDWKWVLSALGKGKRSNKNEYEDLSFYEWNGLLASAAFTQVGGQKMLGTNSWTSTEIDPNIGITYNGNKYSAFSIEANEGSLVWGRSFINSTAGTRPFVKY